MAALVNLVTCRCYSLSILQKYSKFIAKSNSPLRSICSLRSSSLIYDGDSASSDIVNVSGSTITARRYYLPEFVPVRKYSFLKKLTGDEIWQGVTSVSNQGRNRGRAKRTRRKVDLNRGQVIGEGKTGMVWPGLNAPVFTGKELLTIQKSAEKHEKDDTKTLQYQTSKFKRFKVPALQRGWTGNKFPGMSIGPPDPIDDYNFEGFDTKVLEMKIVSNMTGNLGRKRRYSAFVITGNKNGLIGYALAKAPTGRAAMRNARNQAALRLQYIERFEDHTVFHNFHTKEGETQIFVFKKQKGYGLVCHRALKTISEIIGIKDLYAKCEGSVSNVQNITKAFITGLRNQETHKELAERTGLHVVELRRERDFFPKVVASPSSGNAKWLSERINKEERDFENLYYNGKVVLYKPKRPPFYHKYPGYKWRWFHDHRRRNQPNARMERIISGVEPSFEEIQRRSKPPSGR